MTGTGGATGTGGSEHRRRAHRHGRCHRHRWADWRRRRRFRWERVQGRAPGDVPTPRRFPPTRAPGTFEPGQYATRSSGNLTYKMLICGNFLAPRTFTVNGTSLDCGERMGNWRPLPAPVEWWLLHAGECRWLFSTRTSRHIEAMDNS